MRQHNGRPSSAKQLRAVRSDDGSKGKPGANNEDDMAQRTARPRAHPSLGLRADPSEDMLVLPTLGNSDAYLPVKRAALLACPLHRW